ncbi:MAG: hypothetical protein EBY44_09885, partial [Actinobacteria bacterium]|nr:hypothetical protein [Actinomycetota bacterium]
PRDLLLHLLRPKRGLIKLTLPFYACSPDDTDDIAPIIEWLASGTAAPLVGSSLVVDGGLWMPG